MLAIEWSDKNHVREKVRGRLLFELVRWLQREDWSLGAILQYTISTKCSLKKKKQIGVYSGVCIQKATGDCLALYSLAILTSHFFRPTAREYFLHFYLFFFL